MVLFLRASSAIKLRGGISLNPFPIPPIDQRANSSARSGNAKSEHPESKLPKHVTTTITPQQVSRGTSERATKRDFLKQTLSSSESGSNMWRSVASETCEDQFQTCDNNNHVPTSPSGDFRTPNKTGLSETNTIDIGIGIKHVTISHIPNM